VTFTVDRHFSRTHSYILKRTSNLRKV
jgi:hypothetical protein